MTNPLRTVLLAALLVCGLGLLLAATSTPAEAWLANYSYMQTVGVSSPSDGALSNYQVLFVMHPGANPDASGTSTGNNVYLNGKCWDFYNFKDIKFTDANDTAMDYWVQYNDGSSAYVWVKVPAIAAAPSSSTVRVYYSNDKAGVSASNGTRVFSTFEDYRTLAGINGTLWNGYNSRGFSGAYLYVASTWHNYGGWGQYEGSSLNGKYAFPGKNVSFMWFDPYGSGYNVYVANTSVASLGPSGANYYKIASGTMYRYAASDGGEQNLGGCGGIPSGSGTFGTILEFKMGATNTTISTASGSHTDTQNAMANQNVYPGIWTNTGGMSQQNFYTTGFAVRSYVEHEPTVSGWAAETVNTTYSAYAPAVNYVNIVLHSGYTITYPGGTINVLGVGEKTTASDGGSSFELHYGQNYTANYTLVSGGVTRSGQVQFTPNEARYWIDVDTGAMVPDSVASLGLTKTHDCTITVYDWWNPVPSVTVTLFYPENNSVLSKVTDELGQVTFGGITSVKYKVEIKNESLGINYTNYLYFPKDSAVIRLYPVTFQTFLGQTGMNIIGGLGNLSVVRNPPGYSPQSVLCQPYAYTDNGNYYIRCNYNDSSGYTTYTRYDLYTWNIGDNNSTQLLTATPVDGNNNTFEFAVNDPFGKNYELWITGHQTGGDVLRYYDYTWPGPMWRLPGVPVGLYQWICIAIIMAVLLGTAKLSDIGMAGLTCAITTAGLWMSGWMFAWGDAIPPIVTFVFVLSTIMYWNQRNRMEG